MAEPNPKPIEFTIEQSLAELEQTGRFNGDFDTLFERLRGIQVRGKGALDGLAQAKSGYKDKEDIDGVVEAYRCLVTQQANDAFLREIGRDPAKITDQPTYDRGYRIATTPFAQEIRDLTKASGNIRFPDPQGPSPLRDLTTAINDYKRIKEETKDLRPDAAAPSR